MTTDAQLLAAARTLERQACERLGLPGEALAAAPDESWLAYDQVAAALGTTEAATRVRVHRGLSALRARLTSPKEALR